MDGENNGKPYRKGMIWEENPLFLGTSISIICFFGTPKAYVELGVSVCAYIVLYMIICIQARAEVSGYSE